MLKINWFRLALENNRPMARRNRKPQDNVIIMPANPVLWSLDERGVATVTLNRPEVNNAYDGGLIHGVLSAMDELGKKPLLRVVVL